VLHEGDKTVYDSELYIIFDKFKPLQSFDSNGYISDFSVNIIEKSSREIDMIFEMVFVLPMDESDVIVRSWDKYKRSSDYKFNNLIQVIESEASSEIIESAEITFSNSQTFGNSEKDSSTLLTYDLQNTNAENNLGELSENNPIEIPLWIKMNANWWSQEEIGDDDFIAGIKYLIESNVIQIPEFTKDQPGVKEIPSWIRYNAEWWAGDLVSDNEFVGSIQWLIENGVMDI
jgi:hypothetical protein